MTPPLRRLLVACLVLLSAPAAAQEPWTYRPLYAGLRAGALIGTEVRGLRGEELGTVHDLVIDAGGRIKAAAVEADGILGLGEAEFLISWLDIETGPAVTDADVQALIRRSADFPREPDDWRASDLLERPVELAGRRSFGRVGDLVFGRDGALLAVVVVPDGGSGGPYAYPWGLALLDRGFGTVQLPSTPEQLQALGRFDASRMGDGIFAGHPP